MEESTNNESPTTHEKAKSFERKVPRATLPEQYNHLGINFASPLLDSTMTEIRARFHKQPGTISFFDLREIISAETRDVEDQKTTFLKKDADPEWLEGLAITAKAEEFFKTSKDDSVTVSLVPQPDGTVKYETTKQEGALHYGYTIARSDLPTLSSDFHPFDHRLRVLGNNQQALDTLINNTGSVTPDQLKNLLHYIGIHQLRWEQRKFAAGDRESSTWKAAYDNIAILHKLSRRVIDLGNQFFSPDPKKKMKVTVQPPTRKNS